MLQWAGRVAANSFSRYSDGISGSSTAPGAGADQPQCGLQKEAEKVLANGSTAPNSATEAAPQERRHQQQQAAEHGVQSQLQRLQLAQRSLWEGSEVNRRQQDGTTAGQRGSRVLQPGQGPSASDVDEVPGIANSCVSNGSAELPAAKPIAAPAGPPSADQPRSNGVATVEAGNPDLAGSGVGGVAVQPCGIASAGATAAANVQPIGRELFITASYFNHS